MRFLALCPTRLWPNGRHHAMQAHRGCRSAPAEGPSESSRHGEAAGAWRHAPPLQKHDVHRKILGNYSLRGWHSPKMVRYPFLALSFAQAHTSVRYPVLLHIARKLCDTHESKHERVLRYYRYKYRATWKVSLLGL